MKYIDILYLEDTFIYYFLMEDLVTVKFIIHSNCETFQYLAYSSLFLHQLTNK